MGLVAAPVLRAKALEGSGEDGSCPRPWGLRGACSGCRALGVRAASTEACQCPEALGEAGRGAGAGVRTGHCLVADPQRGSVPLQRVGVRVLSWCYLEPGPLGPTVPLGLGRSCAHEDIMTL